MFSGKEVPAVGVSIGIERVFAIMEAQLRAQAEEVRGLVRFSWWLRLHMCVPGCQRGGAAARAGGGGAGAGAARMQQRAGRLA